MSGAEVEMLISFVACGVAIPIIVVGEMRRGRLEQRFANWRAARRPQPQRKSQESAARVACAPRPRLGIDVSPIACPVKEAPAERVCDVIQGRAA